MWCVWLRDKHWFDQVTIWRTVRQLSCRNMCQIGTWLGHTDEFKVRWILKISVLGHEMDSWSCSVESVSMRCCSHDGRISYYHSYMNSSPRPSPCQRKWSKIIGMHDARKGLLSPGRNRVGVFWFVEYEWPYECSIYYIVLYQGISELFFCLFVCFFTFKLVGWRRWWWWWWDSRLLLLRS